MKQLTAEDKTTPSCCQFDPGPGMPTRDHAGKILSKKQANNVVKIFSMQQKKHVKYPPSAKWGARLLRRRNEY
jgi:hypothetical protein